MFSGSFVLSSLLLGMGMITMYRSCPKNVRSSRSSERFYGAGFDQQVAHTIGQKIRIDYFLKTFGNWFTHMDERRISAIHAFGNNIMHVHDVPTFKATQFAPLLSILQKKFPGDLWRDTKLGRQAIRENFANGVIKRAHSLRSYEFILWVCKELSLDLGCRYQDATYNLQASSFVKRGSWEVFQAAHW